MSMDLDSEDTVRAALRGATAHLVVAPSTAAAVRRRARRHRRRQRWTVTTAGVLVLVVGASLLLARGDHRKAEISSVPGPPTAVTVTPGGERAIATVRMPPNADTYGHAFLGWLPAAVVYASDESPPAVVKADNLLSASAFNYPGGGAVTEGFGSDDGHSGVTVEVLTNPTAMDLSRLSLASPASPTEIPTRARGNAAVEVRDPEASRLYLAWNERPGVIIAIGVSTPKFNERDLLQIVDGVTFSTDGAPAADQAGNGPAADAVRAAYRQAFSLRNASALNAVAGGSGLRDTRADLATRYPAIVRNLTFDIQTITFTSPTRAEVSGLMYFWDPHAKSTEASSDSSATWTPTGWKINRTGYCTALGRLGARCPD